VEVAWGVVGNLAAEREQGVQTVDDPQYFKAASTLVKVGVGAAVGTAASSAVVGVAVTLAASEALDAAAAWLERWENVDDNAAADPLVTRKVVEKGQETIDLSQQSKTDLEKYTPDQVQWHGWLPEKSHWGTRYEGNPAARDTLATLMKPGKDKDSAPPAKPFRDQTEQFVEKAFTFPTAVGVPPKPALDLTDWTSGAPKRLFLSIIPKYVPKKRGTFMVDGTVLNPATGDAASIDCAVHYVEVEGEIRYSVLPPGTAVGLEGSLEETAQSRNWAIARNEDTPLPGGGTDRKLHLPIHVGYWPVRTGDPEGQSRLRNKWKDARDRGLVRARSEMESAGRRAAAARQQRAAEELSQVHWTSQMPPPTNFESILKSGRFEVTGTVYFRPLKPFDPDPEMPEPDDRFLSRYQLECVYPRDSRS
jgi:hypothetical protein